MSPVPTQDGRLSASFVMTPAVLGDTRHSFLARVVPDQDCMRPDSRAPAAALAPLQVDGAAAADEEPLVADGENHAICSSNHYVIRIIFTAAEHLHVCLTAISRQPPRLEFGEARKCLYISTHQFPPPVVLSTTSFSKHHGNFDQMHKSWLHQLHHHAPCSQMLPIDKVFIDDSQEFAETGTNMQQFVWESAGGDAEGVRRACTYILHCQQCARTYMSAIHAGRRGMENLRCTSGAATDFSQHCRC